MHHQNQAIRRTHLGTHAPDTSSQGSPHAITTKLGQEADDFTFAVRAKVCDGQVILSNWFEDSFPVRQAFHAT